MGVRGEEGEENVVITDDVVWLPSSISPEADPSSHPHSSSLSAGVRGTLNLETCFFCEFVLCFTVYDYEISVWWRFLCV